MKVFLAGFKTIEKHYPEPTKDIYLLSSFYEHRTGKYGNYVNQENHILDSGAFSFFGGGKKIDWNNYVKKYCDFIKKTNQKLFFELDIDKVTSLEHAEQLRNQIEQSTGKQPIPVWRPSRGIDYWYKMCEEYSYVSISASGAYDSAWTRDKKSLPAIQKMLSIAHKNNCKVHGLGLTSVPLLNILKFDSVDSTTWNVGGKFGKLCKFKNNYTKCDQWKPNNIRVKNMVKIHLYNFNEWVKFQKYADANL